MGNPVHEWVENFDEYEAVFQCTNALGPWDADVTVRAFQTFGWDDATMPGTDLTFAHALSAVMIRYDGDVLAINFGNGHLSDALPDLFQVITSLGWESAEVYHRPESMSALLKDIGTAIPASMAFDVVPAKEVIAISSFAEASSLVSRGRSALQNESEQEGGAGDVMFTELESMTPRASEPTSVPGRPNVTAPTARPVSIVLDDIEDHVDDHRDQVVLTQPHAQQKGIPAMPVARVVSLPFAEELRNVVPVPVPSERIASSLGQASPPMQVVPQVAQPVAASISVVALHDLVAAHERAQAALVIQNEQLRDALSIADEALVEEKESVRRLVEEKQQPPKEHAPWLEPDLPAPLAKAVVNSDIFENLSVEPSFVVGGAINVGVSTFCFDLPGAPVSNDDVTRMMDEWQLTHPTQTLTVTHVHPGMLGETVRWDVLGDLPSEYPWAAQKLVSAMGFNDGHCSLVASVLLELKEAMPFAQMRDVLAMCWPNVLEQSSDIDGASCKGSLPAQKTLFSRLSPVEHKQVLDEIILRLGGLLLCREGRAFVDIRSGGDGLAPEMQEMFTVRELSQSPLAQLFVVHVDALDGPFVTWIVDLLRAVALSYSMTERYGKAVVIEPEVEVDAIEIATVPLASLAEENGNEQPTATCQQIEQATSQVSEMRSMVIDMLEKLRNFPSLV